MYDAQKANHVQGLELQLVELVARRDDLIANGRPEDAAALDPEIKRLQDDLAKTADSLAS